jgi:hypothetical protein
VNRARSSGASIRGAASPIGLGALGGVTDEDDRAGSSARSLGVGSFSRSVGVEVRPGGTTGDRPRRKARRLVMVARIELRGRARLDRDASAWLS